MERGMIKVREGEEGWKENEEDGQGNGIHEISFKFNSYQVKKYLIL